MGCSIKFVRRTEFLADIDYIDFSADGYSLANDGYSQVVAPIGAKSVNEVITLKLQGTSKDDLASMTQEVDAKVQQVQWWIENSSIERYQVWIRVQLDGETNSRQAMLLNIKPPDRVRVFTPMEINANYIGEYAIGVERTPFWEEGNPTYASRTYSGLNSIGGMTTLTDAIDGDASARLLSLYANASGAGTGNLNELWVGIKTDRLVDTPSNFQPVWALHDAGWTETDTTSTADATANDGTALVCDFTLVSLLPPPRPRVIIRMYDAVSGAAIQDQRGAYQVLLRARVDSATESVMVRMVYGFANAAGDEISTPNYLKRVPIAGQTYIMYDMGAVSIPPHRIYPGQDFSFFAIEIDAERDPTYTTNLYLDCLVLIPSDDSFVKLSTNKSFFTSAIQLQAYQAANDEIYGYIADSGVIYGSAVVDSHNKWSMPLSTTAGQIVVAAQGGQGYGRGGAGSDKDDTVDIITTHIRRWRTLRGAE